MLSHPSPRLAALALLLVGVGSCCGQEKPAEDRTAALAKVRRFQEVAISPDGKRVAWVEALKGKDGAPSSHSALFVADLTTPEAAPVRISAGDGTGDYSEHSPTWAPDGSQLAFLSDQAREGQAQVYVAPVSGGAAKRLTDLSGSLTDPRWAPDGNQLGFLFIENAAHAAGPLQPGNAETGVIDEKVYEQRLGVIDVPSGKVKLVSPEDLYVYEYDWAPDGKRCVLSAAHGSGDDNWYIAQLLVLSLGSGEIQSILKPSMQIAVPRWSPGGQTIAFIGGLMSDEGATGGDIYVIPAAGGQPRNLTPNLETSASWLVWHPSSEQILFSEFIDGSSGIARVDVAGGVTQLWKGAETITGEGGAFAVSASRDQKTFALIRDSFQDPPEVWAGSLGEWKAITRANKGILPAWGEAKSLHWKTEFPVQGWLLYPLGYDASRRYPLIVQVHGGPAWAVTPHWLGAHSLPGTLSHEGYFVLMPNPRGSYGQGEKFTRANVKDFGYGDLRDILGGVDEVLRTLPVDRDRLGLTGWSYGGFMTMWAVTQTDRFKAAVAGAGICNWQSYYGENGIDQWMIPYFGASVYDDPGVYAKSSPINFIKRVKTPTLILVGERDVECPLPQSQEFYHALKTLNVKTQLVVYPGEGHGISQPEHYRDIVDRTLAWFDRFLQPDKGKGK
jgi:dipeptidyl aminopeptidase/acylaminoacyl peptidase